MILDQCWLKVRPMLKHRANIGRMFQFNVQKNRNADSHFGNNSYSAGTDVSRQNLTSVDVRF